MTIPPEDRGQSQQEGEHPADPAPASAAAGQDAWVSAAAAFAARVRELADTGERPGGAPPIVPVPAEYRAPTAPAFAEAEAPTPELAAPAAGLHEFTTAEPEPGDEPSRDPAASAAAPWHPAPAAAAALAPDAWAGAPAAGADSAAAHEAWVGAPAPLPEASVAPHAWTTAPGPSVAADPASAHEAWAGARAVDADASAAARFAAASQGGQGGALVPAPPSPPVPPPPSDFVSPAHEASDPSLAVAPPAQDFARALPPLQTAHAASTAEPAVSSGEEPLPAQSGGMAPPAPSRPLTRRERFRAWRFAPVVEIIATVALALALAESVQAAVIKPFVIPSQSMEPTLMPGQRVLVNRLAYDFGGTPSRGDIVVFHPPSSLTCKANVPLTEPCPESFSTHASDYFVKRVIGLPGDTLSIKDGHPVIDGKELTNEPYITPCSDSTSCNMPHTIVIPAGYYYMLGDNRGDSDDSRYWGPVPLSWIIGEVFATYWPIDRIGFF